MTTCESGRPFSELTSNVNKFQECPLKHSKFIRVGLSLRVNTSVDEGGVDSFSSSASGNKKVAIVILNSLGSKKFEEEIFTVFPLFFICCSLFCLLYYVLGMVIEFCEDSLIQGLQHQAVILYP